MTTNKNQKRRVRARMERTGESYTTARAHVLEGQERTIPLPPTRRRQAMAGMHSCKYGEYPWDHWFTRARAAGLSDDLAHLGRSLMREADQHSWCRELWERCGWTEESAEGMIRFARTSPDVAKKHWGRLMETDGFLIEGIETWRELSDDEFDAEYTAFALAFDAFFPADRVAVAEEDPLVEIPGAPGIFAPRSKVEAIVAATKAKRPSKAPKG